MLPDVLELLRVELFRVLPVASVRAKLWYAQHEDGKFKLDPELDSAFKMATWRWFQLTNTSDGRRGQVVCLRRFVGRDPEAGEVPADFSMGSCLFLPRATGDLQFAEPSDICGAQAEAPAGNSLVLAGCLRKLALAQPEANPGSDKCSLGDGGGEDDFVAELVRRLNKSYKYDSAPMMHCQEADGKDECESFAKSYVDDSAALRSQLRARLAHFPGGQSLCGGAGLCVNWQKHRLDPLQPNVVHVAVHATGRMSAASASHPIYLGTDDPDVFVVAWSAPEGPLDQDRLYRHCSEVLVSAPPTELGEDRAVTEVALPRFEICASTACRRLPVRGPEAASCEWVSGKLVARRSPHGALCTPAKNDKASSTKGAAKRFDGSFVICVWHAKLDALEVPFFAMVVPPSCWAA